MPTTRTHQLVEPVADEGVARTTTRIVEPSTFDWDAIGTGTEPPIPDGLPLGRALAGGTAVEHVAAAGRPAVTVPRPRESSRSIDGRRTRGSEA